MMNFSKKAILSTEIPVSYTFTGNSRSASRTLDSEQSLQIYDVFNPEPSSIRTARVLFNKGTVVKIKRAKLVSLGAPGLETIDVNSGIFKLQPGKAAPLGSPSSDASQSILSFAKWNEWEDKDISIYVTEDGSTLWVIPNGSFYTIDDFNIQDNFVGQTFNPALELEVDIYIGG